MCVGGSCGEDYAVITLSPWICCQAGADRLAVFQMRNGCLADVITFTAVSNEFVFLPQSNFIHDLCSYLFKLNHFAVEFIFNLFWRSETDGISLID